MKASVPQLTRMAIGLVFGTAAVAACERDPGMPTPSGDELAECYRMIERAELAINVSGTGLSSSDRRLVRAELDAARVRVLHAWSNREGVGLSVGAIEDESAEAESFLSGIEAEAGLSDQDRLSERTDAASQPAQWRSKFEAALDCTDEVSANEA